MHGNNCTKKASVLLRVQGRPRLAVWQRCVETRARPSFPNSESACSRVLCLNLKNELPAPCQLARRVAAAGAPAAPALAGLPALGAPDGISPRPALHVAVLRVEAPRRVCWCSESARVLHCLNAAVRQVLVLEPVLDPELCGRLLHVFRGAMHRLVGPRL